MAEALGVAASAVQIADIGVKLSQNIYSYVETVATADRRIAEIATKVEVTTAVIEELGHVFDDPEVVARCKASALATARRTLKECESIFKDVGKEVEISKKTDLCFRSKRHARQLLTEKEMRKQAEELIRTRDEAEQMRRQRIPDKNQNPMGGSAESSTPLQIRALPRHFHSTGMQRTEETSEDPTPLCEKTESRDVPLGMFTTAAINSVNVCASNSTMRNLPETESASSEDRTPEQTLQRAQASMLEECLDSLKQMMFKTELLQQALPTTQSLPAWAKENKLAEESSGVKRNLDAVVGICGRESEGPPLKRSARPMEMSPSTSFAGVANPHPQPIIVQEAPVRQKIVLRREEPQYEIFERSEADDRQVAKRPDPREDDCYYERRVREVDHGRGCEDDDYYARGRARVAERDWDSDEYCEQSQHHPRTGSEERNHHNHYKRNRSHSRGRKVTGIAALAVVGALARAARRDQKTDNTVVVRRSRSRTRRHSGSGTSCDEYSPSPLRPRSGSKHRGPEYRNRHIAQAGLASAAVTGLVERARSRSRSKSSESRSRSRSRTGVPIAVAGLSGAAGSTAGSRDEAPELILESPSEMDETKTVPTLSSTMRETDTSGEPPLFPAWRSDKKGETAPLFLTTGTVPEHANLIARQIARDMLTETHSPPTKEGHEASPAPRPSTPQHQQQSQPGTWMPAPLPRPPVPGAQSHSSPRARRLSLSIPPSPSVRPVVSGHTAEDPQMPALQPHQQPLHGRPSQPKLLLATPSGSQATPQANGPRRGVCGLKLSIGGISASGSSDASAHSGSGRFRDNGCGGPPPLLNTTHDLSGRRGARPSVDLRVDDGGSSTLDAGECAMGYRSADGMDLAPLLEGFLKKTVPVAEDGCSKIAALLREWTNVYD